jgi:ubiquinone/menaquinone biosynthesis C-methylase UbiE
METDTEIKQQVREFYDRVGWKEQSAGFYQNATYEDLRPVSHEYIHKCHLRVLRHLNPHGHILLDIGSGPIQYPEYLEYSKGYQFRLCADISIIALQEARKLIGSHGLYVVCDVACLPFKSDCFDGQVSLHTLHHLPFEQHLRAYQELHRTLTMNGKAVIVNGWNNPPLSVFLDFCIRLVNKIDVFFRGQRKNIAFKNVDQDPAQQTDQRGTYIWKETAEWLQKNVGATLPIQIWCWRSVSVRFLRNMIHERLAGRLILRMIYWKEELFPHFFGKYGQYPLVELRKS